MRESRRSIAWVVYRTAAHGRDGERTSVCEQGEWDEMERDRPGRHTLIRAGIGSEPEAEALARDSAGYVAPTKRAGNGRPNPRKRPAASHPANGQGSFAGAPPAGTAHP